MPESSSDVVCHRRRVSCAWRGQTPVRSMLLPTGGRIAAASWGGAGRGAVSPPPDVLSRSCGSKPVLCGFISLGLSGDGQWSPVFCIKAAALMRSELLRLDMRGLWPCPGNKTSPCIAEGRDAAFYPPRSPQNGHKPGATVKTTSPTLKPVPRRPLMWNKLSRRLHEMHLNR